MQPYKYFEHTADCKFQAYGKTLEEAFSNAVLAMINHLTPDKIKSMVKRKIIKKSKRLDTLLYDFLEEFVFLIDTEGFLAGKVEEISIKEKDGEYSILAKVSGDTYKNYEVHGDIKAITYNDMFIKEEEGRWIVQVVVDI